METLKKIAVVAAGVAAGYVVGVFTIRGINWLIGGNSNSSSGDEFSNASGRLGRSSSASVNDPIGTLYVVKETWQTSTDDGSGNAQEVIYMPVGTHLRKKGGTQYMMNPGPGRPKGQYVLVSLSGLDRQWAPLHHLTKM